MFLDPTFRRAGAAALTALMLGTAPAALLAETPPDTLVIADAIDDIVSLDPHEAFEFSGTDVINNIYNGLIELDPTKPGELLPGLAESWSVADDGVTYTFKMKPGITFASGNPLRAEDAAWSLQRIVKLNKNPAFIITQFGFSPENVDQMITAEGDTLTLITDKPYAPTFLYNCLTAQVGAIVDKETVMANEVNGDLGNEWMKQNSAGTGPYVLRSYKPNESYVLDAREDYWGGAPVLKRVFMRHIPEAATQRLLLEKGDIDIAREMSTVDIEGITGNADLKVEESVGGQIYYISMNQKVEALTNPKVLDAMRWAIDYEGMASTLLKGQQKVHQAFLPSGYLGALDDTPYSLDIEKAKALLAESGVALPLKYPS
ncbi:ABC transporter substrate-binding protein [Phaeovulum sp.]|uniref:ABC transporter substrate-binding protein n=1 Tax=Phaeovulum sp. TaxID=2934796 RepID=UPI0039E29769